MKKIISVFVIFLAMSCKNPVSPPIKETPRVDYGTISVYCLPPDVDSLQSRTLFPPVVFDRYVFTFTKAGETTGNELSPDTNGFFTLEVGTYTVVVQAFITDTLTAIGVSEPFTVGSGNNEPILVHLTPVANGTQGEFTYTITYPAGADVIITLQEWPSLNAITLIPAPLIESNGVTETLDLDIGSYLLTVRVHKDGQYAGISEAVHIYPLLTTVYVKQFDDDLLPAATPTADDYIITGIGSFTYDGNAKTASVSRRETASPGAISIFYNGLTDEPVNAGTYTVTFNIEATGGWNAANDLAAGTIVILQPVSPDIICYYWVDQHDSLVTSDGNTAIITVGETLAISAQGEGYTVHQWHLDGVDTGQSGNTFYFSSPTAGNYTVGLFVENDGKVYNTNIAVTVESESGNGNGSGNGSDTRSITIDMYDSGGDGWGGNGALKISVNGIETAIVKVENTATNNTPSGQRNTNTVMFSAAIGDTVTLHWVYGTYQSENSFVVYYTDTPPNPVFTTDVKGPSMWSGDNALIYKVRGSMNTASNSALLGNFTVQ